MNTVSNKGIRVRYLNQATPQKPSNALASAATLAIMLLAAFRIWTATIR